MMKILLVYYSQSGNTKKIAQAIQTGMTRQGANCDLVPLRDANPRDLTGYDLIGLGSPVIHLRELPNVTRFIESMQGVEGKHAFAFCTHGALPGNYLARVIPAMIQRGLTVIGWNDWFGGVVHPLVPKPYFTDGHPDAIDLVEAEEFGRVMGERSQKISQGESQLIPKLPTGRAYDELYKPINLPDGRAYARLEARTWIRIDVTKCKYPKCTKCMNNCPVGSIDLSVSPPVVDQNCDRCWVCVLNCPQGAIEVDWEPLQKLHDPLVENGLQKALEVFAAQGRFRRLVPLEDIGWDTPVWKLKKQNPAIL